MQCAGRHDKQAIIKFQTPMCSAYPYYIAEVQGLQGKFMDHVLHSSDKIKGKGLWHLFNQYPTYRFWL
jgi:hypothetical protein